MTPLSCAREWARCNPADKVVLKIAHATRKGRGGRLSASAVRTYYVIDGRIKERVAMTSVHTSLPRNGVCLVCAQIYLEPSLAVWLAPDPDAGGTTGLVDWAGLAPAGQRIPVVRDELAWVLACAECAHARGWARASQEDMGGRDYARHTARRWHPGFEKVSLPRVVELDIRPR